MQAKVSEVIDRSLSGFAGARGEVVVVAKKVGLCLAALLAIHLLPKERSPENTFRFYLTLAYFAALAALVYNLLEPRKNAVMAYVKDRFSSYPEQIQSAAVRFGISFNRVCDFGAHLLLVFIISVAVLVLGNPTLPWIPALELLGPVAKLGYYISLGGLLLFPIIKSGAIQETAELYRMISREAERFDELAQSSRSPLEEGEQLSQVGDGSFVAGQIEWHWELLQRNAIVFGETGSGKTLCVLNALLEGALSSWNTEGPTRCAALILDPKGDFRDKVEGLCEKLGRRGDLVEIDPYNLERSAIWNPLDSTDDELELADRFAAVMDAKNSDAAKGEAFWIDSARKFVRHAISLIRLTNGDGTPPSFEQINHLVNSDSEVARRTEALDLGDPSCELCLSYFANEWVPLVSETKQAIQAHVSNMIDPFLMSPYRQAFAGRSTVSIPEVIDQGKILYVYMPAADKEAMARTICTFAKLEFQREVKKRVGKERPSLFFCDEFQLFFTTIQGKGDADFFEISRGSNHVNLIATQNLQALYKYAPGKKEIVKNLIGNCASKVFLRNTEEETNEFASKLFGEQLVTSGVGAASIGGGGGKLGGLVGGKSTNVQQNEQRERVVRPERLTRLASPSKTHAVDHAAAVVHISGSDAEKVNPRFDYRWKVHPL